MWKTAALEYKRLEVMSPPLGEDFCACATDIRKLTGMMEDLAEVVRNFGRGRGEEDDVQPAWKPGTITGSGDEADRNAWIGYSKMLVTSLMDRKGTDSLARYLHCKFRND